MLLDIFITLLLVFLNGFFVAAEFAIVKVRASQLELKASAGNKGAKASLNIIHNLDAYLSATQLGVTLASLGLGWIGESVVSRMVLNTMHFMGFDISHKLADDIALPIAFIVITVLHIIFGEQVPKSIAIQKAENTTLTVAYPLRVFYFVCKPVIWLLNSSSNSLLKIFGISLKDRREVHSAEELQLLLEQSTESGAIPQSEHELIKNVFNFNLITVRQIMVPRTGIHAIDIDLPQNEILNTIVSDGYSRMPVYRDTIDNIVGVVYTKDLLRMLNRKEGIDLKQAIRPPFFIPQTKKI